MTGHDETRSPESRSQMRRLEAQDERRWYSLCSEHRREDYDPQCAACRAGTWQVPDWKAECRGLGYMLLDIAQKYELAKLTGGDNELLASSIQQAHDYVDGPLRELLGPIMGQKPNG